MISTENMDRFKTNVGRKHRNGQNVDLVVIITKLNKYFVQFIHITSTFVDLLANAKFEL